MYGYIPINSFNSLTDSHSALASTRNDVGINFQFPNGFSLENLTGKDLITKDDTFQFPNGFSHNLQPDELMHYNYFFQFPNGFSQSCIWMKIQSISYPNFQFPNGFSQGIKLVLSEDRETFNSLTDSHLRLSVSI
mgnify:CR=1 FL=1